RKNGCVYIRPADPDIGDPDGWIGHWEKELDPGEPDRPGVSWREALARGWVEEDRWSSVEEAIEWGRSRAHYVLVYLDAGDVESIYSAGDIHYTELGGPYLDEHGDPVRGHVWPTWPPPPDKRPTRNRAG